MRLKKADRFVIIKQVEGEEINLKKKLLKNLVFVTSDFKFKNF